MHLATRLDLFRLLNGIVTVYKPVNISVDRLQKNIKKILSREFNALPSEPKLLRTSISYASNELTSAKIETCPDIVDDVRVLGSFFSPGDFCLYPLEPLDESASGIQVFGIGDDGVFRDIVDFQNYSWIKTYHITGMLGRQTVGNFVTGNTLARAMWRHVTKAKIDRALNVLQGQFNKSNVLKNKLLQNSQAAYLSLAKPQVLNGICLPNTKPLRGDNIQLTRNEQDHLLSPWDRPLDHERYNSYKVKSNKDRMQSEPENQNVPPYIGLIRCIDFNPPFFTIELTTADETMNFLINLVVNLSSKLKTLCTVSKLRRVKYGLFGVHNTLLLKHIRVPIYLCDDLDAFVKWKIEGHECGVASSLLEEFIQYSASNNDELNKCNQDHIFKNLYECTKLYKSFKNI